MSVVYINGEFLPSDQAKVSVFDRGFLLGDGVYEVIPAYSGNLFRLDAHLKRLQSSLDAIRLENPLTTIEWETLLTQLVQQNYQDDLSVYLQVTRGIAMRDHAFPENTPATVFAMANAIAPLSEGYYENGVSALTIEDNRWSRCNIKAISLLPNVLLRQQAVDEGFTEAILYRDDVVTEGAASNVFVVHNNELFTPPKSQRLLPGITRDLVVELAQNNNVSCYEKDFSLEQLKSADEIWLTSSTKEIIPVTTLNDQQISGGKPGVLWQEMHKIYREYKASLHKNS